MSRVRQKEMEMVGLGGEEEDIPAGSRYLVYFQYRIGDKIRISAINMPGQVDSLSFDIQGRQYRVVYWNDGERHSQWMYDWELELLGG